MAFDTACPLTLTGEDRKARAFADEHRRMLAATLPAFVVIRRCLPLLLIGWCALPSALTAVEWAQMVKLLASDPNALDDFGQVVAIDGERLVVGAPNDDGAAPGAGAAYVFERDADGRWRELQKLVAPDAEPDWLFGVALAIDGDIVAATATGADPIGFDETGAAYVFARDEAGIWQPAKKLKKPDGTGKVWGSSVAVDGGRIAVGAMIDDQAGGAVYLFERESGGAGNWGWVAKLKGSDGGARFGGAVALDGERVVVGASEDGGHGSAYVYERKADGEWTEVAKLTALEQEFSDRFGESVGLSGDRIVVGAWWDDEAGFDAGAAHVFERDPSGAWLEVRKLIASDAEVGDWFGLSVGIDGDIVVVGAQSKDADDVDTSVGASYVFERDHGGPGRWGEAAKLTASDGQRHDTFGDSVAISGERILVGATGVDDGAFDAGAAYLFVRVEPELIASGTCPGTVRLTLSGATPNRPLALVWGTGPGLTPVPAGRCAGTDLGLDNPRPLASRLADRDGRLLLKREAGPGVCDRLLQALDGTTCEVSGVEQLP